MKTMIIPR